MSGNIITEHNLFKAIPNRAETKADITNYTARAIIGAEAERREIKTARLRQARLEAEALLDPVTMLAKPRRAKAVTARRGRSSM